MAASVGQLSIALAFAVAVYGAAAAIVGAKTWRAFLVESARTSAYSLFILVMVANVAMESAILADDFSIRYVAENSSLATPTFFKVLSLWGADEGSLLLWNLVLAGFIAAVAFRFRRTRPQTFPWALATMYGVAIFYLLLVLGPTKPFASLSPVPADGRGPLALLQNHPLMAVHPPLLYLGFIGMTVPFAFAMAALMRRRLSDQWIRITRRWTLVSWVFLTLGLLVGGLWSYGVLGWGGYWAWDPVENVALLPWLTATAFLHSVMVEERRGMLKVWNLSLIVATFALTVFGTFLTRGSILDSVHAFAQSIVGPLYLGFLALILLAGFGLIASRSHLLRTESLIDAPFSREAAFLGNNLGLVVITFTVLLGTIYPLLAEALSGRRVSVGAPYFNQTATPAMLLLLFLMAVGPLVPWKAGSPRRLLRRVQVPVWGASATVAALAVAGVRNLAALAAFGLASFVALATLSELFKSAVHYRNTFGGNLASATIGAARRNRRLFGGLFVHLGLVLAAVAITASSSFDRRTEMTLARGEVRTFARYDFRFEGVREMHQPHRRSVVADVSLLDRGVRVMKLTPLMNFYPNARDPIGTPSIRTGSLTNGFRDIYISLSSVAGDGASASFRVYEIPGVLWLWIGGGVMAAGGVFAAWPSRRTRKPVGSRELRRQRQLEGVAP